MSEPRLCPQCGAPLPPDSPQGVCPKCVLGVGLAAESRAGQGSQGASAGSVGETTPHSPKAPSFVPPTPAELAPLFPQLEIIELLGQGGMGAVYKARQPRLDRLVALKILPPQSALDPNFAERFAREARALARLSHPQIVAMYDFGDVNGLYYFLMEYVDGADLRQLIRSRSLAPEQALAIVPQICDALQYAHDEGVVHRDIKPENVLVDRRGRVKIADFGLAKLLGASTADITLTRTQQVMGTPNYMAPEQIEHPQQVDHRADIYSLGVVFYEMLTGELPMGRFDPPSEKVAVDVRLDDVVLRALQKEPQRRYQHASEFKTDVNSIASGTAPAAAPVPTPAAQPAFDPKLRAAALQHARNPAIWLLTAGLITCLLGIGLAFWSGRTLLRIASTPTGPQAMNFGGGMTGTIAYSPPSDEKTAGLWVVLVTQILAAAAGAVTAIGALQMLTLQHRWLAVTGTALALVPLSPAWLAGLPLGLWSLAALKRADTQAAFDQPWHEGEQTAPAFSIKSLGFNEAAALLACLLGALATVLPWGWMHILVLTASIAGFDTWHGMVTGGVFTAALIALAVLHVTTPNPIGRLAATTVAGLTAIVVATVYIWPAADEIKISNKQIVGDDALKPLGDALANSFFGSLTQGLDHGTLIGPYVVLALGVILIGVTARQTWALLKHSSPSANPLPADEAAGIVAA
jgi:tRNA A-37 threonylcarbamoyl transferase component Bud32